MPQQSAGILLYRFHNGVLQVLLAHPGGPFWQHKDAGVWSIPKGLLNDGETTLDAALREFREELGTALPVVEYLALPPVKAKGGKVVYAFAAEGDLDTAGIVSNTFRTEYPYRSGHFQSFPEVDRAAWFTIAEARIRILPYQAPLLDALQKALQH